MQTMMRHSQKWSVTKRVRERACLLIPSTLSLKKARNKPEISLALSINLVDNPTLVTVHMGDDQSMGVDYQQYENTL